MSNVVNISAQIPRELGDLLEKVSREEERSKTYYIKKGLEMYLAQRKEMAIREKHINAGLEDIKHGRYEVLSEESIDGIAESVVAGMRK